MFSFLQQVLEWFRKCAAPNVVARDNVYTASSVRVASGSLACGAMDILTEACDMQLVLQARNGAGHDRSEQSWQINLSGSSSQWIIQRRPSRNGESPRSFAHLCIACFGVLARASHWHHCS